MWHIGTSYIFPRPDREVSMTRILVIILLMAFALPLDARILRDNDRPTILTLPDTQLRVHHASNILFSVTNFGILGSFDGQFFDSEGIFDITPGIEFPAYSNLDYLFFGSIWVGGVIDTVDGAGDPILDTLVSVGYDAWWGSIFELYPPRPGGDPTMWRNNIVADEEIFAIYSDSVISPNIVPPDPFDGPHVPLGITIHQHSICWSSAGYDEVFIIDFAIENIYDRPIHDVWFGIFYDGDVYHRSENPYGVEQGAQDDLCGFVERGTNRGIAWLADNNGQPYNGQFDLRSPTGVMGITLLHPLETTLANFNWWISNIDSTRDWGPQWQGNFDSWGRFPGGGRGTPGGDKAKYQVMSNGEHDYDQARSALPHDAWIAPPSNVADIANGYDTRYLISIGPLQLAAGQIETVTVALVGGNNFHTDPQNYANHLLGQETDSAQVAQYYQGLGFGDLIAKADSAYAYYERGFVPMPIGPPQNLHVSSWNTHQINLAWSPSWYPHVREYRLYRGTAPGQYNRITPDNFRDTTFADTGLQDNAWYYYVITTVKDDGIEGGPSRELAFNTGRPQIPTGLTATRGNTRITLNWQANNEGDIAGYVIRRGQLRLPPTVIDTTELLIYTDTGLQNGLTYDYCISAFDTSGNESSNSPIVSAIPMGLDSGILVINMNRLGPYNPDFDSMTAFYQRALAGVEHTFRNGPPGSLSSLAPYSTVIWSRDLILGHSFVNPSNAWLFQSYLDNGGKLIIEGTRNLVEDPWFADTMTFGEGDFRYDYLNLAGVEYPDTAINSEFIGAWTDQPDLPQADVDTARANRIVFPQDQNDGRLFGIGTLIPRSSPEAFYYFNSVNPDTSRLQDLPVATLHMGADYILAIFEFPLYFIREPAAIEILRRILGEFGELSVDEDTPLPEELALLQNYPNPFNAQTTISFDLPYGGNASLTIYNILGQEVATLLNESISAGRHDVLWNAADLPSGLYFARLDYGGKTRNIKMLLLK
jgi:hypothetical protein